VTSPIAYAHLTLKPGSALSVPMSDSQRNWELLQRIALLTGKTVDSLALFVKGTMATIKVSSEGGGGHAREAAGLIMKEWGKMGGMVECAGIPQAGWSEGRVWLGSGLHDTHMSSEMMMVTRFAEPKP
jgi:hypothetical protein